MKKAALMDLPALDEGFTTEFKRSDTPNLGREICAFANATVGEADLGIKSIPRNPLLFGLLHRMEAVEHIGSDIKRIRNLCREYGVAEPRIEVSEHWFTVTFPRPVNQATIGTTEQNTVEKDQVGTMLGLSRDQVEIMRKCITDTAIGDLMSVLGRTNRTKFRDHVLTPLLQFGLVQMTIPDKPRSSKQRYR